MKLYGIRWLLKSAFAACLIMLLMIFRINCVSSKVRSKIIGVDCTDDISLCGSNGKCVNVDQEKWNYGNASEKSICKCSHNWHGDYCSVCMGRFSMMGLENGIITNGEGNYTSNTNCTWLLSPETGDKLLRLKIDKFSTECGWDHLYIHDGLSFDAPLVAVLSGFVPNLRSYVWSTLTLTSGSGYFYFTSDSEFNMPGFHIDFSYVERSESCSGNGIRNIDGSCGCYEGWVGLQCSHPTCPNNCSYPLGVCHSYACSCLPGFRGDDCSQSERNGYWEVLMGLDQATKSPPRVASHKSIVINDQLYIIGGYSFTPQSHLKIFAFNIGAHKVHPTEISTFNAPQSRYGHAVDIHDGDIYLCGGTLEDGEVSDELWVMSASSAFELMTSSDGSKMVGVSGHSMHVIDGTIFVFFGHSPSLGYINFIQRFNLSERVWSIVRTSGTTVTGLYGHTSVYDEPRSQVLVHGGFSSRSNLCSLKDDVISFNVHSLSWKYLRSSGHVKYLHSSVILDGLMFVFGGNTHNDTAISHGARCFSSRFLAYDIECDHWYSIDEPNFQYNTARFGHVASVYKGDIYFYGGFNGILYNDLFKFSPGTCNASSESECLRPASSSGSKCAFVDDSRCIPLAKVGRKRDQFVKVQEPNCPNVHLHDHCKESKLDSCLSCVVGGCSWCGDACRSRHSTCSVVEHAVNEGQCEMIAKGSAASYYCSSFHSCHTCMQDDRCIWVEKSSKFKCEDVNQHLVVNGNRTCSSTCSEQTSCDNCTSMSCMWCLNRKQCIDSNSYVTSFPYGICHEWTIEPPKCQAASCDHFKDCQGCLQNPSCGFCNFEGDTGGGRCMEGRLASPLLPHQCPDHFWNFADCPLCQCSGHSTCHPNTDICIKCQNHTEGQNCERCQKGYWKDPKRNSACIKCECGDKADSCDPETGACLCRLRGAAGRKCEECDMFHRNIEGSCFYELSLNYMLTFNLSKSDNQHHTEMNMFVSTSPEKDVELNLNCSSPANLTISLRKDSSDITIIENMSFESYAKRFTTLDLKTQGDKNSTILLFIRHFSYPFVIQVSFSQADQLDLFKFFITFFSCFFSLLLIAFLAWKFKQRYDVYRRTQRHLKEMAEMASRPCGKCFLVVDGNDSDILPVLNLPSYNKSNMKMRHKQTKAVPIAVEPLSNQKSAILSIVVRLPHADEPCALPDQSGLAIASTLITFGNRRSSTDPPSKLNKLKSLSDYNSSVPRLV